MSEVGRLVYICHPFSRDPSGNAKRVRQICERLKGDCVPLAPHLLLPAYIDEATERGVAIRHCLRLLAACDEMMVFGEPTAGMRIEIAEARRLGVRVVLVSGNRPGLRRAVTLAPPPSESRSPSAGDDDRRPWGLAGQALGCARRSRTSQRW